MANQTKPSHGPLIAILGGMALVVVGLCGGAVYMLARGVRGMERMIEERRGPTEVVDDAYRLRVTVPTDGDPSWELWGHELSQGWDPDGLVVLRNHDCAAGLSVWPLSSARPLADQLGDLHGDAPSTPRPAPPGATGEARALTDDDGSSVLAFGHAGQLYRIVGEDPCVGTLFSRLEILDANVRPRRLRPSIASRDGRGHQVRDDVFTSAATGLRVDASAPFSLELDDLSRDHPGAEVVVLHENGTRITLDPYRGLRPAERPRAASFVVTLAGREARFASVDEEDPFFVDAIAAPDDPASRAVGLRVAAWGVDRERIEEALRALEPRIGFVGEDELARLRAALPPPADRRAGLDWSLRDGVFREHPSDVRPRAVLRVPPLAEVLAGVELVASEDASEGRIVFVARRDLGVSARLLVTPTAALDAREEIARATSVSPSSVRIREIEGDAARASVEVAFDQGTPLAQVMHTELVLAGGWSFELDAWWSANEPHPEDAAYVEALARGFEVEPALPELPPRQRHVDARLGFALEARGGPVRPLDASGAPVEAASIVTSSDETLASITVVAASDAMAASCRDAALDLLGLDRTVAAIDARPGTATTLDGRPATLRTLGDVGVATRIVETRIDRTTYVVAVRSGTRADWQSELARVELDP